MENHQRPNVSTNPTGEDASTAALKKALQIELQNKKQCSYQPYECSQLSLNGYKYCARHILNDKNAPFKQCNYTFPNNGKKCHLPALKGDKKDIGYCNDHALKATLVKNRQNCKYQPPHTAEVILSSLSHYIKKQRTRTHSQQSDEGGPSSSAEENIELKVTKNLDPFTDIDAFNLYNTHCNEVLSYCSESDSDVEPSTLTTIWHDAQGDSSDNESIDSEQEDYLKHANVYTAEEITAITRNKLIRLQSLYIEEYRHLQHLLKERRRKYVHSIKREKETCCNIYNQVRDNPKEQRLFKKLKAYNSYHKAHGVEAIFTKRLHDLRVKITEGMLQKPNNYTKCLFTEGGVKCGERTLPLARHCRKHILEDPSQVLFRSCGRVRADVECNTPVEAIFEDATCRLHADIPTIKSYSQTRKDSESDYEDLIGNPLPSLLDQSQMQLPSMANIKSELSEFTSEVPKMESVPSMLFEDSANDTNEDEIENIDIVNERLNMKDEENDNIMNYEKEVKLDNSNCVQEIEENKEFIIEENIQDCETQIVSTECKSEMERDEIEIHENGKINAENIILNEISDTDFNKSGESGKTSDIASPMEIDDGQLDESTDTASETANEMKKEPYGKDELNSV